MALSKKGVACIALLLPASGFAARGGVSAAAIAAASLVWQPAQAQNGDGWQYRLTPYIWASALNGDVGLGGPRSAELDQSFDDILDKLDFAFMTLFEARKGRWSVFFDGIYMKISEEAATPGPFFGDANGKVIQQVYSLAGTYRVVDEGRSYVDVLGGVRYFYIKTELDLPAGTLPAVRASDSVDWVDGYVGLRAEYFLDDRWSVIGYGDIGGGGSDLTWQAFLGLHYAISKKYTVISGYRYMSVDYDGDDFLYDVDTSGMYLGLNINF